MSFLDYDVIFADREGGRGGFDFLAQANDRAFEVEGKCVPAFLGGGGLTLDVNRASSPLRDGARRGLC